MTGFKRIIFLGSPDFAVPMLQALIDSQRYRPITVITMPDRPAGRNMRLTPTPVKELATANAISVLQPDDINEPDFVQTLQDLKPDILITAAYGAKLKKAVRNAALLGAINVHPSLLPLLRGAAPVPFTLWQGHQHTGITIFRLVSKMDAGPIFHQKQYYIFPSENSTELLERLAWHAAEELVSFLDNYFTSPMTPVPQDESLATYCRKLQKEDCLLDWHKPASELHCQIRALALQPGAQTTLRGNILKILETEVLTHHPHHQLYGDITDNKISLQMSDAHPGTIISIEKNTGFTVLTGNGFLLIKTVQPAGKKAMSAWAYHLGAHLQTGEQFS